MSNIKFESYVDDVEKAIKNAAVAFLYEGAGEIEAQVKRNTRVDTGQLKGSWSHTVDTNKLEATIGSPLENAIWEEFGTGEYALNGGGRSTPWVYQDAKGNWHRTTGKKPSRAFHLAAERTKPKLAKAAKAKFKGLE